MPRTNTVKKEELKLDDSVKVNKRGEAILGRLTGPCADIINPTRNNRYYSEALWEKVFNNDIVKEYFESGGILGELDHPTDRLETCTEKIAICMPEPPVKDNEGHLIGTWDILDTPNGRIAYTLAKYGYKLGISSRGNGDVYEDMDGSQRVDEDTYDFQAFDLVLLPAVKAARLKMVESLEKKNGKSFKEAITEALEKSTPDGRKVMQETLENLRIDYTPTKVDNKEESKSESLNEDLEEAAISDGVDSESDLEEALKENRALRNKISELQEKLSVCYAKEIKNGEEINRLKSCVISITENNRTLKASASKNDSLQEQVKKQRQIIEQQKVQLSGLTERQRTQFSKQRSLNESLSTEREKVQELEKVNSQLKEDLTTTKKEALIRQGELKESIEDLKKDAQLKKAEYDRKIERANSIVEKYQKIARTAINKYIESKAVMLGVTSNEIKQKLPENYSFDDIDSVCESLQKYKVNISRLPLDINSVKPKMRVTESKEPLMPVSADDEVDSSLLRLANLN